MQRRTLLCAIATAALLLAASPRLAVGLLVSDGLVGYWKADGNGNDATPNANHATAYGTEVYATGRFGQAFDMGDGEITYLQTSDSAVLDGFSNATWSFWLMPDTLTGPGGCLDKRFAHNNESSYSMGLNYGGPLLPDGTFGITVGNTSGTGEGGAAAINRNALTAGQWNHVAVTFDKDAGENFAIYVNGTPRTLTSSKDLDAPLFDSSAGLTIGRANHGEANSVEGLMDDIAIYDRTLSSYEVLLVSHGASEIDVGGRRQGGFGHPLSGATNLIEGVEFNTAGQILKITASGTVYIGDDFPVDPDGVDLDMASGYFRPVEEQIVDAGGTVGNPHPYSGALMGAFVPAALANDPSFVPFDDDVAAVGIPSDALFVIGSGPYYFESPGPGKLFLGVNDNYASNNSGAFSVNLRAVPIPEPGSAAVLLGLAGLATLVGSIRRGARPRGRKPVGLP